MSLRRSSPPTDPLRVWRLQALNWILRGQFLFWLLAYAAGVWNAVQSYRQKAHIVPSAVEVFLFAVVLYSMVLALMALIAFVPRLGYRPRAFIMLGVYYLLSLVLFSLSALSGDARFFLFAFVVLAAILLDMPWNILSLAAALLSFAVMGWLNITGVIRIAAELQYNATDPSAWTSGGVVFAALSISISLGITYLLRSFANNLSQMNLSLQNERRTSNSLHLLSNINQLIARTHQANLLLEQTCQAIVKNGYACAAVGLLQPDGTSLTRSACAGASIPLETLPDCADQAIRTRSRVSAPPALAIPILRPPRAFGVLVIFRENAEQEFDQPETALLQELANDLAYALENIETENQRRFLAETAAPLLAARDEAAFWQAALQAVQSVLRADRAAVYVYDDYTDRLSCPYSMGLSQEYIDEINRHFREDPGSRLFRDTQPVPVNDTKSDPLAAPLRALFQREGIRSYVVFPLFSANKLLGAFVAYRNSLIPFSQPDLEEGQTLSHLMAASLQNERLLVKTRAKAAEQAVIYAAAQDMAASLLDPPALLETFARHLAIALNATSVYIISADLNRETLTVLAEYWSEAASPAERKPDLGRMHSKGNFPHVVQSMKSGKILTLQADEPGLTEAERNEYLEYGAHTKLFVPLMSQGRLVGYVEIWESRRQRKFTQNEMYLAQAMASYAANVIHTANLLTELEKSEAYFRALIENAGDGVAILSSEGIFRYFSPAVSRILGYQAKELLGKDAFDLVHPEDRERMLESFLIGIQQPDIVMRVEYRFLHSSQQWIYLEATAQNLLHNSHVAGIVVNYHDISERKRADAEIQRQSRQLIMAYDNTLDGWARALELRDKDTEGHTRRVTELALRLARAMNIPEEQLIHIQRGATLHDIGKVAVPDSILHKAGSLTPAEQEIIHQHPRYAYEMLHSIEYLRPALDIPYCHHEKWDGTGYPRGLKSEQIPLVARIFSVVDVWDALTSDRPYRKAWSRQKALNYIIENSGTSFDPRAVEAFLPLIKKEK